MKTEETNNFTIESPAGYEALCFTDSRAPQFATHGLMYDDSLKQFLRMPASTAETVSENVANLNKNTSGGRVRFKTNSGRIAIKCLMNSATMLDIMPQSGVRGFSLYVDNVFYKLFRPTYAETKNENKGFTAAVDFPQKKLRNITIYFPLYNEVSRLYVGLEKNCEILPANDYQIKKPILFYGSSITQGGCASRPGNSYDAVLCRYLDADYINLGFSGNAKGEPAMAEYLGALDVSVFVFDYDHNAPDAEHLRKTHFPFYSIYRRMRPDVPVILMSRPGFDADPETNALRRKIIMDTFEKGKSGGDKNLYFIDGETLFSGVNRDGCTMDGIHPNDLGFQRMADTVHKTIQKII